MLRNMFKLRYLAALAVAAALGIGAATPAFADKPASAGNGKGKGKSGQSHKADNGSKGGGGNAHRKWDGKERTYFQSNDRVVVNNYYAGEYRKGKGCPPGLAKKNNGCLPPGQAKKWRYGHPLPRDVVWYEVPRALVIQLPSPPSGYRYVRVASDILMIAVGTSMVVDAIQDLGSI